MTLWTYILTCQVSPTPTLMCTVGLDFQNQTIVCKDGELMTQLSTREVGVLGSDGSYHDNTPGAGHRVHFPPDPVRPALKQDSSVYHWRPRGWRVQGFYFTVWLDTSCQTYNILEANFLFQYELSVKPRTTTASLQSSPTHTIFPTVLQNRVKDFQVLVSN